LEFLETLPQSEDKKAVIPYLKQSIGYTLCGGGRERVVHVLKGPTGSGKGTFLNTFQEVLGTYAVSIATRAILTQRWASNGPTPDLARLPGARFARMSETSRGQQMDTSLVKQLTGGDFVTARGAYAKNVMQFTPICGWWLDTNELPYIASGDSAIWGRLRVIECPHSHEGNEDTTLKDRLMLEAPGILAWGVEGAREYLALESHKLTVPECVARFTKGERDAHDGIREWLEDGDMMDGKGYRYAMGEIDMPYSDLYRDYREWCIKNKIDPMGRTTWGQEITDGKRYNFRKYRGAHNTLYLTDTPEDKTPEEWMLEN
jgi:putative DNA primase/helicase